MPLLTDSDLAGMRETLADSLPDTATIQSRTQSSDDYGGQGETWSGSATAACRIEFAGGDVAAAYTDQQKGPGIEAQQLYVVTMAYDAAVSETNRLVISGVTYDVVSDVTLRSEQVSKRLLVKQI